MPGLLPGMLFSRAVILSRILARIPDMPGGHPENQQMLIDALHIA